MTTYRKNWNGLAALFRDLTRGRKSNGAPAWGRMIIGALLAFEIFNFSTTQFALLRCARQPDLCRHALGKYPGDRFLWD